MKRVIVAALAALVFGAEAASVQVVVTDKDGRPAADVVVLVGSTSRGAAPAATAAPVVIAQEGLRFVPFLTVVPTGTTLRFVNKDSYDHHVRSMPSGPLGSTPPAKGFELRLDAAAEASAPPVDEYAATPRPRKRSGGATTAEVRVDTAGPIGLGCHLHASMRGQVYVSPTPWFAKTDADGKARVDDVPDGAITLSLWHADQLIEQPVQQLQAGAAPLVAQAQLNFVPRRRRP